MTTNPKVGEYWYVTNHAAAEDERHYIIRFTRLQGDSIWYVIEWTDDKDSESYDTPSRETDHQLIAFHRWKPMHKSSKEELEAYQLLKKLS